MRIFITGSLGFIGSHLVPELLAGGHEVVGLDRHPPRGPLAYRCESGDVADPARVTACLAEGTELILHLAAEHRDEGVAERDYYRVNGNGTANLLAEATRKGVR